MKSIRDWTARLHSKDSQRRGRVVGAGTKRAAGWNKGLPMSLDREVGQRLARLQRPVRGRQLPAWRWKTHWDPSRPAVTPAL